MRQALPIVENQVKYTDAIAIQNIPERRDKDNMFFNSKTEAPSMAERFPLDEALIAKWEEIRALFQMAFSLCSNAGEYPKKLSRGTLIDNRSCGWFIAGKWINSPDFQTVMSIKTYSEMIVRNRPEYEKWLKQTPKKKQEEEEGPLRVSNSILTIPPCKLNQSRRIEQP